MLKEAVAKEPPRNLQQRVQALVFSWDRAQTTFYGVSPEADLRGQPSPPHRCSPFVPAHDQYTALKDLLGRASTSLWQTCCFQTERRVRENPVHLLHFILELNPEALQLPIRTNEGRVHLKVTPGRHSEVHKTTGDSDGKEATTLPVSSVKALDRRAITFDELVEANRISYES